ncbi:MAG: TlpA family protein disulfide reductase [Paucimonas sp.]|jgi:thiol-disulfide isomerase/thioredoxin|nr:TlpA family protein disulfide reductase [Paucimonas sp.]
MLKRSAAVLATALLAALPAAYAADLNAFQLTDTKGVVHSLEKHQGKWVLVNIWATWCAPCLAEMPELQALSASRSDLVVLGVAADGQSKARVMQFAGKLGVTYPIVAGNADSAKLFKVRAYPTTILFDARGRQVFIKEGIIQRQEIEGVLGQGKPG